MGLINVLCASIVIASILAALVPVFAVEKFSPRTVLADKGNRVLLAFIASGVLLLALAILIPILMPQPKGDYLFISTATVSP